MASFYVIRGKDNGQHFAIRGTNATIGREATNQIQLRDTEVSRQHAKIIRTRGSQFEIVDCGSSNGTYVNSRRVDTQRLRSGDRVQVGRTLMIFTGGPEPYSTRSLDAVKIVDPQPDELSRIRSSIESQPSPQPLIRQTSKADLSPRVDAPDRKEVDSNNWEIVYQVSQAISRTIDLNELMTQVLDLIFQWIECDRGCILMLDDVTGSLTPIYSRDRKQADASENTTAAAAEDEAASRKEATPRNAAKPITISRTILDHVVSTQEGVLTGDAQEDARWQNAESVANLGVHEAICVPMLGRYGLVGTIYIDTSMSAGAYAERRGKSCFDEDHLKLMIAIAGQAALAIEDTQFYSAMVQSERLAVMGQTIANLSHHVKNILQGVSGGSFLVEEGLKNQELELVRKGWAIVEKNQSRISHLVMDMLSYSKEREPDLRRQDVRRLVDDVVDLMSGRAAEAQVELRWQRPEQPLEMEFDDEAMHRAVLNVVSNAIDAATLHEADPGAGQVVIDVQSDGGWAAIVVVDNGPGISEENKPRIFAPFESTKGASGTGLGLSVSQKILREHGGDISFESQLDHGATFVLRWPAADLKGGPTTHMD